MAIAVIDQGTELYWFISNALLQDELPLKHLNNISIGEQYILQELPKIVVLNGDDGSFNSELFIAKIRNHVFARSTLFIVVTADTSPDFKKSLIIAGAGQIFYRGRGHNPSPKFFRNIVKWFLNIKTPDPLLIEYKPAPFPTEGDFTTFGRIGWVSSTQMHIEVNLDLVPGQTIEIRNSLFDELEIKNATLTVQERNTVGRYYQYTNGFLCKIETKHTEKDQKKLQTWIDANQNISKYKPVKVLYFEKSPENREQIKGMIKLDKRYCARGFPNLENLLDDLDYQLPHLVLVDRQLIEADPAKFDPIKKFLKANFCYCITYDNTGTTHAEEYGKKYEFALHIPSNLEIDLLESMIAKLEKKLLAIKKDGSGRKVFFNKHSPYSRMSLHSRCKISELALSGVGLTLPFAMSSYCAFEVVSAGLVHAGVSRMQYFRSFICKKMATASYYHQCVFMGQTLADNELIKKTVDEIKFAGIDAWKNKH